MCDYYWIPQNSELDIITTGGSVRNGRYNPGYVAYAFDLTSEKHAGYFGAVCVMHI